MSARGSPVALVARRRLLLQALLAAPWLGSSARAADETEYPTRPIRMVLPSTIGGTSDLVARVFADRLGSALGQPIVIDARPGAAGRIAVENVANAAPDGYTLLLANNGANAIVPAERGAPVSATAFAPVTMLVRLPIVIAVTPTLGVARLSELIERARNAPGKLSYASSGVGSTSHIAADLLFHRAGVRLVHVPYSGTSAAVRDVLSGEVPVLFTHLGTIAGLLSSGRLRGLAVTGDHRMAEFPELPTVAEAGYRGFEVTTWHGVVAPAGTPRPIIERLRAALLAALDLRQVRAQLAALGMEPVGDTPEQFAAALAADVQRWSEMLHASGSAVR
ncbi:MAG TPA: tripartite tricarboxylate transporter substrate binding protein [Casimicrobiaceae bacterium]|nr:tripartite tricarboxylate transporter substrate binding protein [Casimicrobiaceae bacterium]